MEDRDPVSRRELYARGEKRARGLRVHLEGGEELRRALSCSRKASRQRHNGLGTELWSQLEGPGLKERVDRRRGVVLEGRESIRGARERILVELVGPRCRRLSHPVAEGLAAVPHERLPEEDLAELVHLDLLPVVQDLVADGLEELGGSVGFARHPWAGKGPVCMDEADDGDDGYPSEDLVLDRGKEGSVVVAEGGVAAGDVGDEPIVVPRQLLGRLVCQRFQSLRSLSVQGKDTGVRGTCFIRNHVELTPQAVACGLLQGSHDRSVDQVGCVIFQRLSGV